MSQSRPSIGAFPEQPSELIEPRSSNHNLPASPTPLIGRKEELATLVKMLRNPDVRLLTLIGPPGIGKTRLGIQVASDLLGDFPDRNYFVPFAPISDPDLVLPTITQIIGVKEMAGQPLLQSLQSYLRDKSVLLLLDNFEQLVDAAPLLADLLTDCPGVRALVTSRELLHLYGEYDYPVPSLSLPGIDKLPDFEALSQYEAVELFVRRAQAVSPSFQLTERNAHAIAEICVRLDGLPLAIELAAARILVLPPEELLARLTSRLKLLTGGARNLPERQRTLQMALEWSYNLLDPEEQALFRRLGVFVGGCSIDAIEKVCGTDLAIDSLDGVTSLVGKSLLSVSEGFQRQESTSGEPRFHMLETIREYAWHKVDETAETNELRERHADYFLKLVEKADPKLRGPDAEIWLDRLEEEHNNLRAALEWSLTGDGLGANKGWRRACGWREL